MTSMECTGELGSAAPPLDMADQPQLQLWAKDNAYGADNTESAAYFKTAPINKDANSEADKPAGSGAFDSRSAAGPEVGLILGDFRIEDQAGGATTRAQTLADRPGFSSNDFARVAEGVAVGMAGAGLAKRLGRIEAKVEQVEAAPVANVRATDTAMIDPSSFSTVAKAVLAKVDAGHTGLVTKAQLAAALQDPSFKGEEAQALAAMYQNFDAIHNLSSHEYIWNTASITTGDLDSYQSTSNARYLKAQESSAMKDWAHNNLLRFTSPGCENITKDDIEAALKRPHLRDIDRQMLNLVKKYYGEMDSWYNYSGISEQDINLLADGVWNDTPGKMVSGVFASCYNVSEGAQKAGICYDLYSDKDALQSINPDGVKQGSIGDCYYEAVVAALAKANPAVIRDSIKDNHDGTYTVTFPGAPGEPITVKGPTETELGEYNHGSKYGVWASVLEKAYGKYRDNHAWIGSWTPQEGADGGGQPGPVIKLLTGKDSDTLTVEDTAASDMASRLEAACKAHKTIATGINADSTWKWIIGQSTDKTSDNFYKQHEYTISGFEPDGRGGGNVIIRNPWGQADDTPSGTIKIPLATFMKNFSDVTIQK